jgi:hypothetical protein
MQPVRSGPGQQVHRFTVVFVGRIAKGIFTAGTPADGDHRFNPFIIGGGPKRHLSVARQSGQCNLLAVDILQRVQVIDRPGSSPAPAHQGAEIILRPP